MNYPKVSIITPSYNQGQFIERTILSVLEQDYPNIEYIVIDGGSTDNTLEILKKYEDQIIWKSELDKGQSDAVNKGFLLSTGKIIGWLNSDDTYKPGAISYVVRYFSEHPDVGMIYGGCDLIDINDKIIATVKIFDFDLRVLINSADIVNQPSAFFRRNVFSEVGMLDINLKWAMDLDLWIKIALKFKIQSVHFKLANFRKYPNQKSATDIWGIKPEYRKEILRVSRKYGGNIFNKRHRRVIIGFIKGIFRSVGVIF